MPKYVKEINTTKDFIDSLPHQTINVCAISPNGGAPTGITVDKDNPKLYEFIEKHNGKNNLYYSLNEPDSLFAPQGKCKKTDIDKIHGLHVDIDLKPGIENTEESIKQLDNDILRNIFPLAFDYNKSNMYVTIDFAPTYVVDTGGGIQIIWILHESLENTEENRLKIENYGKILEKIFKCDNTHNIDRILRLPFTENIPDKKKIGWGRKRRVSSIMYEDYMRTHDFEKLDKLFELLTERFNINIDNHSQNIVENKANIEDAEINEYETIKKMKKILRLDNYIVDLLFGLTEPPTDKSRSGVDFIIIGRLNKYGFTFSQIKYLMKKLNSNNSKNTEVDDRYILRCIERYDNER